MDGGLFNGQRSNDRRAAAPNRAEAVSHRPQEESHPPVERHRQANAAPSGGKNKSGKKIILAVVAVIVVAALAAGVWFGVQALNQGTVDTGIDKNKYQAVFFTNGQVYFGKLTVLNGDFFKLTDIFYLQTKATDSTESENPQTAATGDSSSVQLIKLGSEVHGPEDAMVISRDQLLFYENIKADGKVGKSIKQYNDQ